MKDLNFLGMKSNKRNIFMKFFFRFLCLIFFVSSLSQCRKKEDSSPSLNVWKKLSAPSIGQPQDIKFIDADTGYVLGTYYSDSDIHNILIKTFDGGNTWQTITFSKKFLLDTSEGVMTKIYVSPFDSKILFSGGQNLIHSTDGGFHWQKVDTINKKGYSNIHFFDLKNGISSGGWISKTSDSGYNWIEIYDPKTFGFVFTMLQFTDNQTGYAAGGVFFDAANFGLMVKTSDGGNTWGNISYPFKAILGMSFLNDNTGYISLNTDVADINTTHSQGCEIAKTTDGGINWNIVNKNIFQDYSTHATYIHFINEKEGFFSGEAGVFYTKDEAKSWQKELDNRDFAGPVILLSFPNNKVGFAVDATGAILKRKLN